MVIAMFLAHLVGDYVLQWDGLARWKSREVKGAVFHGLIVLVVTWLFTLPLDPSWWPWALFIGLTHVAVDGIQPWLMRRFSIKGGGSFALMRLIVDQTIHLSIIVLALVWSGYVPLEQIGKQILFELHQDRWLAFVLAYVFIAMPAWILVELLVYGLVGGCPPDMARVAHLKYVGTLERWLIATFVVLGQFALIPVVTVPRLVFEGRQVIGTTRAKLYVAELLASVALAVAIGLGLRYV